MVGLAPALLLPCSWLAPALLLACPCLSAAFAGLLYLLLPHYLVLLAVALQADGLRLIAVTLT